MSGIKRWLPLLAGGLFLLLLLWALYPASSPVTKQTSISTLPPLTLTTLNGESLTTDTLLGQPFLLNVWASWCTNCRKEHALLQTLSGQLPIIGLNYRDTPDAAKGWLHSVGDPYSRVIDDQQGLAALALGVIGTPESWLIGPHGEVLARYVGPLTSEIWQTQFLPHLSANRTKETAQ